VKNFVKDAEKFVNCEANVKKNLFVFIFSLKFIHILGLVVNKIYGGKK